MQLASLTFAALVVSSAVLVGPARAYSTGAKPVAVGSAHKGKVGLLISGSAAGARITDVLPGTPADRAGLVVGDELIAVDGRSIAGLPLREVVGLIAGPPGTVVSLVLRRQGGQHTVKLKRASLGRLLNAAIRDPQVGARVRTLVRAQGGRDRIKRIASVTLTARGPGRSFAAAVDGSRYRFVRCRGGRLRAAGGYDGKRSWGRMPALAPTRADARALLKQPYALLPNLRVVDFADPGARLRDLGTVRLAAPSWVPFKLPARVQRFRFEDEEYDFSPGANRLVRFRGADRRELFFGGYRRIDGIAVAEQWAVDGQLYRLQPISFARPPADAFSSAARCPGTIKRAILRGPGKNARSAR